jgi:hypothetical protein
VDYHVQRFLGVPGPYEVSAAMLDHECRTPFDVRHRFFGFDALPGHPNDSDGIVSMGGSWSGGPLPPAPPAPEYG